MSKDIEQIIDDFVVPEMEYEPKYDKKRAKKKGVVTVTIDDIPEVVLPKTHAEVVSEAKGRLTQKSAAVSRKTRARVSDETAATTYERRTVTGVPLSRMKKPVPDPVWVGSADELVPFAWRNPLVADIDKPSKVYRAAVKNARELLLPAPRDGR